MFQAQRLAFYTCVSPVHMGVGQAVGAVDNPIQREVHTGHPLIAGSGLKGAVRHHFTRTWKNGDDKNLITRLFGPERDASEHAGAIAFTDAILVAFPVRSLKNTFVYATCPTALARLLRLTSGKVDWNVVPRPRDTNENETPEALVVAGSSALSATKLVLESFEFNAKPSDDLKKIANWLAAVLSDTFCANVTQTQ